MSVGMPIGSLVIGYAAQAWGTLNAALLPAFGMAATVLPVQLTSNFWNLTPHAVSPAGEFANES